MDQVPNIFSQEWVIPRGKSTITKSQQQNCHVFQLALKHLEMAICGETISFGVILESSVPSSQDAAMAIVTTRKINGTGISTY